MLTLVLSRDAWYPWQPYAKTPLILCLSTTTAALATRATLQARQSERAKSRLTKDGGEGQQKLHKAVCLGSRTTRLSVFIKAYVRD